jgi:glutamate N-acetyltransferase/amino-acid N-acetyltransferase
VPAPIVSVPGFRASGVACGIKKSGAADLALIVSDAPAAVAGVFTRSTFVGAPVEVSRARARNGRARAVVVNSGCSNVAMGERGLRDARAMAAAAARELGLRESQVLVASTGVIGQPLPLDKIRSGIAVAARELTADGLGAASRAIMTTDTFPKQAAARARIGGRTARVAGICKGSGMIQPDMATMLAFVVTDAGVTPPALRAIWRAVADATFNRVTVDGESSTSDTALCFANGLAGNAPIARASGRDAAALRGALESVASELAQALARDGEGATKLVTVDVRGAASAAEAERAARRIANSMLVKTAIFGGDPNWGRILQTVGAGRVKIDAPHCRVKLGRVAIFERGASAGPAARERAALALKKSEIPIEVVLGRGPGRARIWTCDLSYDYVRINAEYTT